MPTPLDFELEKHEGPEPRVLTVDVQQILQLTVRPDEDDGISVALVAERADISPRTVYRVLNPEIPEGKSLSDLTLSLDLADRLCLAVGSHIAHCRLRWPDGSVTPYF